jgi:hypothetical protein
VLGLTPAAVEEFKHGSLKQSHLATSVKFVTIRPEDHRGPIRALGGSWDPAVDGGDPAR